MTETALVFQRRVCGQIIHLRSQSLLFVYVLNENVTTLTALIVWWVAHGCSCTLSFPQITLRCFLLYSVTVIHTDLYILLAHLELFNESK